MKHDVNERRDPFFGALQDAAERLPVPEALDPERIEAFLAEKKPGRKPPQKRNLWALAASFAILAAGIYAAVNFFPDFAKNGESGAAPEAAGDMMQDSVAAPEATAPAGDMRQDSVTAPEAPAPAGDAEEEEGNVESGRASDRYEVIIGDAVPKAGNGAAGDAELQLKDGRAVAVSGGVLTVYDGDMQKQGETAYGMPDAETHALAEFSGCVAVAYADGRNGFALGVFALDGSVPELIRTIPVDGEYRYLVSDVDTLRVGSRTEGGEERELRVGFSEGTLTEIWE